MLPESRGEMTAIEVMAKPAGTERDEAIHAWAADVWTAFRNDAVETVRQLCEELPHFGGA